MFIVLAMGEGFVLLLGEIDLSIGYVAAIGGIVAAAARPARSPTGRGGPRSSPALLVCGAIGAIQGTIITRLRMPSFIVTLAGYLIWFGVMIIILGNGRRRRHHEHGPARTSRSCTASCTRTSIRSSPGSGSRSSSWCSAARCGSRDARRRRSGLVAPPVGLTVAKIGLARGRRDRRRRDLQRQPRQLPADRRGAVGRARSSSSCSSAGPSCSSGRSSGATSTPSAATPRRPAGPASTSPRVRTLGVRPVLGDGGHRRHHLLLPARAA